MSETLDNTIEQKKRPSFLTVLCILSFIWAGVSFIILLLGTVLAGAAQTVVNEASAAGAEVESEMSNVWLLLIVAGALIAASLVGVIKMWKLQKQGFYIYTGAAVAGIIVDIVIGGGFNVVGFIFAAAFVVMYGLNVKHMS